MNDPLLFNCFAIADRLHLPVDTVMSWPIYRIDQWLEYFAIRAKDEKEAANDGQGRKLPTEGD